MLPSSDELKDDEDEDGGSDEDEGIEVVDDEDVDDEDVELALDEDEDEVIDDSEDIESDLLLERVVDRSLLLPRLSVVPLRDPFPCLDLLLLIDLLLSE